MAASPCSLETSIVVILAVAEIFIRILTPQGFTMIQTYEEEDAGRFPGQTWWSIVEQHSQVFTRRVVLLADPL